MLNVMMILVLLSALTLQTIALVGGLQWVMRVREVLFQEIFRVVMHVVLSLLGQESQFMNTIGCL